MGVFVAMFDKLSGIGKRHEQWIEFVAMLLLPCLARYEQWIVFAAVFGKV